MPDTVHRCTDPTCVAKQGVACMHDRPRSGVTRIDLPGLRAARDVLRRHKALLGASARDLGMSDWADVDRVVRALDHVLDDDYRSDETRGGS